MSDLGTGYDNLTTDRQMADDDVQTNKEMGKNGAELFHNNDTIMTHCNAGALATVGYGTALGVIRALKENGSKQVCCYLL